jgi:NADH-quinone oxidoreductase subunit G
MIELEVDGKSVQVKEGSTVMDAANQLGIYVPHFCYHKKLSIAANCRMCLVQVEKAPKPLPACATPVANGMKVYTHSESAIKAQKGVMEFLLINHPLDCPICDQGGECQLQDLAVGYGGSASRYTEVKRVVINKNLGPLVSTDMTRCIHCTRCVRFGEEIAGIMELGMAGRGEHSEIMPFIEQTVNSELSGNIIDLCPVGALTSKPFRYTARTWELSRRKSVSPHCGLGSNLAVHVKQDRVMRVLPNANEEVNECWLSDKDRFAYEGLNSEERLTKPMIKHDGIWQECEWQDALEFIANGLKNIADKHGAEQIGALATPHQTFEELYLLQKLMRGLGSSNVDFRLRQSDFGNDTELQGAPWLGFNVSELPSFNSILVIGSNLRKDHPLLAQRLRQAAKKGTQLNLVNPLGEDLLMPVANQAVVAPAMMVETLAQILKATSEHSNTRLPAEVEAKLIDVKVSDSAAKIAQSLQKGERRAVLIGNLAQHHPQASTIYALAQALAERLGAPFGVLGEAANSVGGYIAGAVPMFGPLMKSVKPGMNAAQMFSNPRKAYVLLGVEAELDTYNSQQALQALKSAELVVAMSAYKHHATEYAHVLLPIAPFSETSGTFINTEGRVQNFRAVVKPLGETRPAWKILRVLGNLLQLEGFEYNSSEEINTEIAGGKTLDTKPYLNNNLKKLHINRQQANGSLQRIGDVPIYHADAIVRRAPSLQRTVDAKAPVAAMNSELLNRLNIKEGNQIKVRQQNGQAVLTARCDNSLPANCIRVPAAHSSTATLGGLFDEITVERV